MGATTSCLCAEQETRAHPCRTRGTMTKWHDNGTKSAEAHFKEGKQEGTMTQWHENGTKSRVSYFENGEEVK